MIEWNKKLTPQEIVELTHARELPAWTMLKVRDPVVGWRAFTAHEICILNEMFELEEGEYSREVGHALGLLADEKDDD